MASERIANSSPAVSSSDTRICAFANDVPVPTNVSLGPSRLNVMRYSPLNSPAVCQLKP